MKRGHVTGTRQQRASASDWYRKIAEATLARLEATWLETNDPVQEVTHESTHDAGTRDQELENSSHAL